MNATLGSMLSVVSLLVLPQLSRAQIGATKEELIKRYGLCASNPAGTPKAPNVYDGIIDVGEDCTFRDGQTRFMALFKSDRAVGFYFTKLPTFWSSLLRPSRYSYLPLSDAEISTFLRTAVPTAEWLPSASDAVIRRWGTSDSSAAAYYFAGGNRDLYHLVVHTADVDQVFRRVEKY